MTSRKHGESDDRRRSTGPTAVSTAVDEHVDGTHDGPSAWVSLVAMVGVIATSLMLFVIALEPLAEHHSVPPKALEPREATNSGPMQATLVAWQASGSSAADPGSQINPPRSLDELTINELVDRVRILEAQLGVLRAENAQLQLKLGQSESSLAELQEFIRDHDTYGAAYEEYSFFRAQREREQRARAAAEAKARREAEREQQRLRAEEARERYRREQLARRGAPVDPNDPQAEAARRHDILRRAGYTQVGESVYVSEMGTSYRTESDREVRYSYLLGTWYVDENEIVDFTDLTISGTVIHSASEAHDVAIAVAFYNKDGGQIGETVVRVEGARGGVPYPFTSRLDMAATGPFDTYASWVLYFDPVGGTSTTGNNVPTPTPAPSTP